MTNLDRFLTLWLSATKHGTYRAFAYWEGGYGVENKIAFQPVTDDTEQDAQEIRDLVGERGEVFVYLSTFSATSTSAQYAEPSCFLWLDLDEADPRTPPEGVPLPTVAWETSEGHYQALWMLDMLLEPEERRALNHGLYERFKDMGADPSYDASRRLRLPGTVNMKPGRNQSPVLLLETTGEVYSISEFMALPVPPGPAELSMPEPQPGRARGLLEKYRAPAATIAMWSSAPTGDRSQHMASLLLRLHRLGMNAEDMFDVASAAPGNKFRGRPEQLWREVLKVKSKYPAVARPGTPTTGPLWHLQSWGDLMSVNPDIKWIVPGWWPVGACGMVYGLPGSRKSWLVTHFFMSVLTGQEFLGSAVLRPGPVIVHALDDPTQQFARRVRNVADSLGIDLEREHHFHWTDTGLSFRSERWLESMKEDIRRIKPVLVVIDGLYLAGYEAESHGADLPGLMNPLKELRREAPEPGFMIVHHAPKSTNADVDVRVGGAGSIFLSAWSEVAWRTDSQGIDEHGRQVVHLDAASKFGMPPKPLKLAFGSDPLKYEVEFETRELSEANVMRLLEESPSGATAEDIGHLLGRPERGVLAVLLRMEKQGTVSASGKGHKRVWFSTAGGSII